MVLLKGVQRAASTAA
jgi:hypothetical protein